MKVIGVFFVSILLIDLAIRKKEACNVGGIFGRRTKIETESVQEKGYFTSLVSATDLEAALKGKKDERIGILASSSGDVDMILNVAEVFGVFEEIPNEKVAHYKVKELGSKFKVVFYSPNPYFPMVQGFTVEKELSQFTQAAVDEIMKTNNGILPLDEVFRLIQEEFLEYKKYFSDYEKSFTEDAKYEYGTMTAEKFFSRMDKIMYEEKDEVQEILNVDLSLAEYSYGSYNYDKDKPMALQSLFRNAKKLLNEVAQRFSDEDAGRFQAIVESNLYRFGKLLPLETAKKLDAMVAFDRLIFRNVDDAEVDPGNAEKKTRITFDDGEDEHNFFINAASK